MDACIYAEIRTRIPDTISWDYNFEPAGSTPLSFTVKVLSYLFQTWVTFWNSRIENGNGKSIPFSFANVFGLFFRMRMRIKNFIIMETKSCSHYDFDSSLLYDIMIHLHFILFPFLFAHTKWTLNDRPSW